MGYCSVCGSVHAGPKESHLEDVGALEGVSWFVLPCPSKILTF